MNTTENDGFLYKEKEPELFQLMTALRQAKHNLSSIRLNVMGARDNKLELAELYELDYQLRFVRQNLIDEIDARYPGRLL